MWSPNLILKEEKQRDIFAYITLLIFQVKKGSLKTFPFYVRSFFKLCKVKYCKKMQKVYNRIHRRVLL